ncbi:MAG TPA: ATP-binding cassette domain-containing protein [Myxococcota bacterium]|nr:ATP-binding cassette domain-containing protein [Myxococcota bacterium]
MPGTSDPHLKVSGVALGFDGVVLLENIDFQVERGEIFAILGGSGSGKTTLLRHMIGLDEPMRGEILVDGAPPQLGSRAPDCGVLFQSGALFGSMTLGENVALPLATWTNLPRHAIDAVVRSKLRLVGLGGFENHMPAELSGGMKKRAGIARALALEPELVYLDEPSAGLDPITSAELDELLLTLNRGLGTTLVLVTHELASIFAIASRCIMLDRDAKGPIALGKPADLRDHSKDPRVVAFFNRKPAVYEAVA